MSHEQDNMPSLFAHVVIEIPHPVNHYAIVEPRLLVVPVLKPEIAGGFPSE
jgi:hypothetical protein